MAPVVASVWVDRKIIDNQNSFLITAVCQDCDYVYAAINGAVLQLEPGQGNNYSTRVHAVQVGTYTGDFYVYAVKETGPAVASQALGSDITITYRDPYTPGSFLVELYKAQGIYKTNKDINILEDFDTRRVNTQNELLIAVKEGKSNRENIAQDRYKNLRIPLIITVSNPDSYKECRRLFEQHVLYVNELNANLDGEKYDRIRMLDDGDRIPAHNTYMIKHVVELVKYLKKVEIAGA